MLLLLALLAVFASAKVYTRGISYGTAGQQLFLYTFHVYPNISATQSTVPTAPIYVFLWPNGTEVTGQRHVIDVLPGNATYSDMWQVNNVAVNATYVANTIKSYQGIVDSGYTVTPASTFVNCPVVNAGDTLEMPNDAPLVHGWYQNNDVVYFDFGPASTSLVPLYHVTDSMGNFIQPGNTNIALGSSTYGFPFWKISFNATAVTPFPVTTWAQATANTWTYQSIIVNCPVSYIAQAVPVEYALLPGWYKNKEIWGYDFGALTTTSVISSPIYTFVNSAGTKIGNNVIATYPGIDASYSPLWNVFVVTVPDTYVANTLTDVDSITASGYNVTAANKLVNCPVAPMGSTLDTTDGIQWPGASVWGWYKKSPAFYFDFGVAPQTTNPVYVLTKAGVQFGYNVVDVAPGDTGASPFWQVFEYELGSDTYEANSIKNAADLMAKFNFTAETPTTIHNSPIAKVGASSSASGRVVSLVSLVMTAVSAYALCF